MIPNLKVDKYPVSNQDYKAFLDSSGWAPAQKQNWLRHWSNSTFTEGQAKKPVIWVSHGDAEAYCAHYGARLPHTWEWQWFAQGDDGRGWPWGYEDPDETRMPVF